MILDAGELYVKAGGKKMRNGLCYVLGAFANLRIGGLKHHSADLFA